MNPTSYFENLARKILHESNIAINGDNPWDIHIHDKSIYRDVFLKGSLGLGDGYVDGKWDVQLLDVFFEKLLHNNATSFSSIIDITQKIRDSVINSQLGKKAFQVGQHHYDLGNKMYEYMLGESMGYSSGMYINKTDDLTKAQYNKFDALCQKLHLKPGMKILEIGSGWGTFARHAAQNYGVEVLGLTVSKEQKAFAEKRCKGLPVTFQLLDYQRLPPKYTKYFDRVVSIEMIEAVGRKNFHTYFTKIEQVLKNNGLFGLQAIIGTGEVEMFLALRIFPNGLVPSQADIVDNSKKLFRIKHWDSFGKDYDRTLLAWDENFKKYWPEISNITDKKNKQLYDEKFYRMWRYYLLLCAASFRTGRNDVAQIVMAKQNNFSSSQ